MSSKWHIEEQIITALRQVEFHCRNRHEPTSAGAWIW
jgi:hypothetical protein